MGRDSTQEEAEKNEQECNLRQHARQPPDDHRELHQREIAVAYMNNLMRKDTPKFALGYRLQQQL